MRHSAPSIKRLIWMVGISIVVAMGGTAFDGPSPPSPGRTLGEPRRAEAAATTGLLAFSAGGHALGFRTDGVYVASGDHALKVEFAGTSGVAPVADQASSAAAPLLGEVRYSDLWPGISLVYEPMSGGIAKSTYLVEPGARVEEIRLRYNVSMALDDEGGLTFEFASGEMRESAPVAWQEIEGERVPVDAAFRLLGEREVGLAVGPYDGGYALVVDPGLTWNTFLGGDGNEDIAFAVAVDGSGNLFIAGHSNASWATPLVGHSGSFDAFVAKLNSSGLLQWNTFLGGAGDDRARGIALDGDGNLYIVGYSNSNWGSPVTPYTAAFDAFVAKLNGSGGLQWSTFLGGGDQDYGRAIAVDGSSSVYVTGESDGTWGLPKRSHSGSWDAFVTKLDGNGGLSWNTFLGGTVYDYGYGLALDGSGNVFVAGNSSADWGTAVHAYSAAIDAYIAKLSSGGDLQWNTFLGGSGEDYGYALALDGSGSLLIAGKSDATWGSPVRAHSGGADAYVAEVDNSGNLSWNTFLGGSNEDHASSLAPDGNGNLFVGGDSRATWGSPTRAYDGIYDAFVAKVDSGGSLLWNIFLGGGGYDLGNALAADGSGNEYLVGSSSADWGSPISGFVASADALVAKVSITATYADPAGSCGSNTPCVTSLQRALDGLPTGGTASLYAGTYAESLSLSRNVTATLAADAAITGSVSLLSGTLNTAGFTLTVSGGWSNSGGSFSPGSGGVIFDKAGTATLSKTGAGSIETFCNLTISSTTTLDVGDDFLAISGGCSLTNSGAIRREAPAQTLASSLPVTFTDALAYPTTVLTSTGETPLGSTAITVTMGQTPQSCNGEAFAGTPVKRWYQVTPAATAGVAATLRLYYTPGEANGTTASNVAIFHCGDSGGWMQLGGSHTRGVDENGNYYVEVANVTTFSDFGPGEGSPTAVEVSSLAARGTAGGVEVMWATGPEVGVVGFNVWRAPASGGEWTKLNSLLIPVAGDLLGRRYDYADRTALPGVRYDYRLEIVDMRGESSWHGPVGAARWGWSLYLPYILR